ncbi:unnamed protein product [Pedinophyceae sp. YPF-701]|nr:unnamed protein product [Pedinophyceae sp. YPF-701]
MSARRGLGGVLRAAARALAPHGPAVQPGGAPGRGWDGLAATFSRHVHDTAPARQLHHPEELAAQPSGREDEGGVEGGQEPRVSDAREQALEVSSTRKRQWEVVVLKGTKRTQAGRTVSAGMRGKARGRWRTSDEYDSSLDATHQIMRNRQIDDLIQVAGDIEAGGRELDTINLGVLIRQLGRSAARDGVITPRGLEGVDELKHRVAELAAKGLDLQRAERGFRPVSVDNALRGVTEVFLSARNLIVKPGLPPEDVQTAKDVCNDMRNAGDVIFQLMRTRFRPKDFLDEDPPYSSAFRIFGRALTLRLPTRDPDDLVAAMVKVLDSETMFHEAEMDPSKVAVLPDLQVVERFLYRCNQKQLSLPPAFINSLVAGAFLRIPVDQATPEDCEAVVQTLQRLIEAVGSYGVSQGNGVTALKRAIEMLETPQGFAAMSTRKLVMTMHVFTKFVPPRGEMRGVLKGSGVPLVEEMLSRPDLEVRPSLLRRLLQLVGLRDEGNAMRANAAAERIRELFMQELARPRHRPGEAVALLELATHISRYSLSIDGAREGLAGLLTPAVAQRISIRDACAMFITLSAHDPPEDRRLSRALIKLVASGVPGLASAHPSRRTPANRRATAHGDAQQADGRSRPAHDDGDGEGSLLYPLLELARTLPAAAAVAGDNEEFWGTTGIALEPYRGYVEAFWRGLERRQVTAPIPALESKKTLKKQRRIRAFLNAIATASQQLPRSSHAALRVGLGSGLHGDAQVLSDCAPLRNEDELAAVEEVAPAVRRAVEQLGPDVRARMGGVVTWGDRARLRPQVPVLATVTRARDGRKCLLLPRKERSLLLDDPDRIALEERVVEAGLKQEGWDTVWVRIGVPKVCTSQPDSEEAIADNICAAMAREEQRMDG